MSRWLGQCLWRGETSRFRRILTGPGETADLTLTSWSAPGCHTQGHRSQRARLFLIVDDHSRLFVHGRWFGNETLVLQRGLQETVLTL